MIALPQKPADTPDTIDVYSRMQAGITEPPHAPADESFDDDRHYQPEMRRAARQAGWCFQQILPVAAEELAISRCDDSFI